MLPPTNEFSGNVSDLYMAKYIQREIDLIKDKIEFHTKALETYITQLEIFQRQIEVYNFLNGDDDKIKNEGDQK